jgi:hypothetical protein
VKVKVLKDVAGTVMGDTNGLKRGQVVDWPEDVALRQMYFGLVEPLDAAEETPEQRKVRTDKAREAMRAHALPMQEAARAMYEEAQRANIAATKADAKRRLGWH